MSKDKAHPHHQKNHGSTKHGLHKDWRAWLVVLLMVGLMFAYLASRDERDSPVQGPSQTAAPLP